MMKFMPYDPSHEEVYNAFIMKTEPKTEVFSAKPTETDRQEAFWNRNYTSKNIVKMVNSCCAYSIEVTAHVKSEPCLTCLLRLFMEGDTHYR